MAIPPDQVENLTQALTDLQRDTMLNKLANDQLRRDIIAGDFRPNLEQVLKVGNVADKGVILTNAENDALLLSPEEGRVMVGGFGDGVVPRYELRHTDSFQDTSIVKLELDEDGARFDIECDEKVSNIHFRFEDEAKLDINKKGDAVFAGKVQGEPGTQNNEFVTFGQLTTLEEEIEQLAPSLERGSWNFTLNHPPGPGEYTMISGFLSEEDQQALCTQAYTQCYADNMDDPVGQQQCSRDLETCQNAVTGDQVLTTDDWTQCEQLVFNPQDSKGVTHEWAGIDSDHYIDVFNEADEGFMVGDIATHGGGTFAFDLVSSRGVASGLASVKIFKTEGTVDFDQYVRKAGDTMKGRLTINPDAATPPLYIYNHEDVTANTYSIRQFGVPYTDEEGVTQRDTVFYTTAGGDISGGVDWKPTRNQHLANVKYVHDQVNKLYYPARFSWIVKTETSAGPVSGQIQWNKTSMSDSTEVRVHFKSYDGKLDLFDVADEKVVYDGPTNSSMMITGYYIGSDTDQKWKWKGTANITKITVYKRSGDCYFKCNLGSYKTSNATFNDGGRYYFTIPGLF